LRNVNRQLGVTVVVVTHDPEVSGQVERTVAIRDGRTSSEVLRRTATSADGGTHVIAEEYAVMDRAGRVQVPRDYREALALTRRAGWRWRPTRLRSVPTSKDTQDRRAVAQPDQAGTSGRGAGSGQRCPSRCNAGPDRVLPTPGCP
jgi:energy-coupling factor transporter ATP-binding protein EcfA2